MKYSPLLMLLCVVRCGFTEDIVLAYDPGFAGMDIRKWEMRLNIAHGDVTIITLDRNDQKTPFASVTLAEKELASLKSRIDILSTLGHDVDDTHRQIGRRIIDASRFTLSLGGNLRFETGDLEDPTHNADPKLSAGVFDVIRSLVDVMPGPNTVEYGQDAMHLYCNATIIKRKIRERLGLPP